MLGHDQTDDRRWRFGGIGRLLVVALAMTAMPYPCAAGDEDVPSPTGPIQLSAERVQYWDEEDGTRWVILQGGKDSRAAAIQDGDGLRADSVVARVRKTTVRGLRAYEVEAYAEGHARTTHPDSRDQSDRRVTLRSTVDVQQIAFTQGGLVKLEGPPTRLPLLSRAFPRTVPTRPTRPVPPPLDRPAAEVAEADDIAPPLPATLGTPKPLEELPAANPTSQKTIDPAVRRVQGTDDDFGGQPPLEDPGPPPLDVLDRGMEPAEEPVQGADDRGGVPFPLNEGDELPPALVEEPVGPVIVAPLLPETRRTFSVFGNQGFTFDPFEDPKTGDVTIVFKGGINVIANLPRKENAKVPRPAGAPQPYSTVDLTADNMIIYTRKDRGDPNDRVDGVGGSQKPNAPLQIYLRGHVRIRQDERRVAGKGDEKVFEANEAFYDMRTQRLIALDGKIFTSSPALLSPLKTTGERIDQYREVQGVDKTGDYLLGPNLIRIDQSSSTGSRFPYPGYRFRSRSIDITDVTRPLVDQTTGGQVGTGNTPAQQDKVQLFEAYSNTYFIGPVPVFYTPYTKFSSDFDPILRNIKFQQSNVFGQQIQLDISGFRLLNIERPPPIDVWNIDVDYLSRRGPALGSEIGYFGRDIRNEIRDPYNRRRLKSNLYQPYYGYLDFWGIRDTGRDVLGPGPAIITYGPPRAGNAGYQRLYQPTFRNFRGRVTGRHMQSLLGEDANEDEDFRIQLEAAYISDRNFLEEYYKRQFDTGLDQETLAYGIRQKENRTLTLHAEANLQDYYTDTQWLPKVEYTRLNDGFFDGRVNTSLKVGADYANTHTDVMVNNPYIFALQPYDPVSNTSGTMRSGRLYSAGQVDVPLNFEFFKIVPYAQGQVVGWDNQLGGQQVGRLWGAIGARLNVFAWRTFTGPQFESELLNVHGLAHKMNFQVDARDAASNVPLNHIYIQDDLDDNAYEYTRRYFAITNYVGGILPPQYDPRFLTLRRAISPVTGTTDVQGSIETVQFSLKQRLQTKRGVEGRRHIIDYMTLDLNSTYYPQASRDNFGKPFGQNMYNYEWFIGDRTSFVSYGWFEFWDVTGKPITLSNPRRTNDPFGLDVITAGFSVSRPPRGSVYVGYSIVNTGPISTSAINASITYWLSPKWYGYAATSYDFGNAILLGSTFSFTKIGKDYLTSVGFSVDPQRMNYQFAFEFSPRFSPNVRFGSTVGPRFDSRFAPSE